MMSEEDVQKLEHGLYRVYWKKKRGGGKSLAAVGSLYDGQRWLAPANWTSEVGKNPTGYGRKIWKTVKKMQLLISSS